jgi:ferrochelatase
MAFDAVLVVSFGGPEGPDDVLPFLRNVLRGRPVPPGRVEQVAAHYLELGGVSPINAQNCRLVAALQGALSERRRAIPVYWGNRNWDPYLSDVVGQMGADGVRRAAAFVTAAYSSYSSCRQYVEDLTQAQAAAGPGAPEIVKLRPYFNHPGFVEPLAAGLRQARTDAGPEVPVLMTAHSIPTTMAAACDYERQLRQTAGLVAEAAGEAPDGWRLVFQSRSGPPQQPWLEPDINAALDDLASPAAIVVPIGFVSDHMEVVYDLDRVAAATAADRGVRLFRTPTPGTDPRFVAMILDLMDEGDGQKGPTVLGPPGPRSCPCATGCWPSPPEGPRQGAG